MRTQTNQEYKNVMNEQIVVRNTSELLGKLNYIHNKLEDELTVEDIENLNPEVRGYPNYLKGTFDEDGIPNNPVLADAYDNIVLGLSRINVLEGGVRAGKDVVGIALVGDLFMLHPANIFLVLGVSLEHAIQTVFNSDGFGLFYVIPHGRLTRENIDGAQRVVYRFRNFWGIEKRIVIYGNSSRTDWEKFHGFSIGACYVNEGINQEIRGIEEADQRMIASPMPVMVITQNPEGPMNPFYKQFEQPRLPEDGIIETIKELQEFSKTVVVPVGKRIDKDGNEQIIEVVGYDGYEKYQYKKMFKEIKKQKEAFLIQKERPSYESLDVESQIQWNNIEARIRYMYEKHLRGVLIKDIFDGISEQHPLARKSWKKVVHYKECHKNPNGVLNNVDYSYYHITMEDNQTLTEAQKAEAESGYAKGSALYLQKIKGVRKAVDSAVWGTFTEKNVFYDDIYKFKNLETKRVIAIDFGAGKASGIADYELDYETGDVWQTREKHITPQYAKSIGTEITDDLIYEEYLKILKDGKKNAVLIVDPANTHLINYFKIRGINAIKTDKRYEIRKGKDNQRAFEGVDTDLIGLELVNLGFEIRKIHIHNSCNESKREISSYEYNKQNETTGKRDVIKVEDEFCDLLRYVVSTMFGGPRYWYKGGEVIGGNTELSYDEKSEVKKTNMGELQTKIQRSIAERGRDRYFQSQGGGFGGKVGRDPADRILNGGGKTSVGQTGFFKRNGFKN